MFALMFVVFSLFSSYADYGGEEIAGALPDEVREELIDEGITPESGGAMSLSAGSVFDYIIKTFKDEWTAPVKMFTSLTVIILICSLAETLRDSARSTRASDVFGMVAVLSGAGIMTVGVSEAASRAADALSAGSSFLLTFIPVFAGIMAITGQLSGATAFAGVLVAAAETFSVVMTTVLVPLTTCVLGVSVAGAVNPDLKVERLAEAVKKIAVWVLGLMTTVFVGLLSLQSFVTSSADSVAMKAAKFVVSGGVPFIGGAVGDALAAVKGSVSVVRASTGTFGIIAALMLIAPPLISAVCVRFSLTLAAAVSEMFGTDKLTSLIKCGESVMSVIFAMMSAFLVLAVVSIAVTLAVSSTVQ